MRAVSGESTLGSAGCYRRVGADDKVRHRQASKSVSGFPQKLKDASPQDLMLESCLGGVPREQRMLKAHLPRVIYHQVY